MASSLRGLFDLLDAQVEAGVWWPGESRFEIVVGAVLTQNTAWTNVESAIANLKAAGVLEPRALLAVEQDDLAELIRPAGFQNAKARYLAAITDWFVARDDTARGIATHDLRRELLGVLGVGPETADDILLYVYDRPVFIYDLYARRLLAAAGFGDYTTYGQAKRSIDPLVDAAQFTTAELAAFHGLIVDAGKLARRLGGWEGAYPLLRSGRFMDAVQAAREGRGLLSVRDVGGGCGHLFCQWWPVASGYEPEPPPGTRRVPR